MEQRRYASEVDVDFVRKSVKAIGQCAIKIESAADRCVNVLMDLINTRVSYVVQEAVVVMKVRCFPSSLFQRTILMYDGTHRISSASTPRHTKASSRRCVPTLKSSMNQRRRPRSSGLSASTQRRSTTPSSCSQYSWIHLGKMHTPCVLSLLLPPEILD
jgi:vesicle coat complex subunit